MIKDKIEVVLRKAIQDKFEFSKWQRVVLYKHALEPLSIDGSLKSIGGRFNVGDINTSIPSFPALYIAKNKTTALQEKLCQKTSSETDISSLDSALNNKASITSVSLSGSLNSIINLKKPKRLMPFINLIKNFTIPKHLKETAKKVKLPPPTLIEDESSLINAIFAANWREWSMLYDVPTAPQIFGQLVKEAGIEGILYPSKFTREDCLVIFPENFNDISYIQLDDEIPKEVKITRLDAKIWSELY